MARNRYTANFNDGTHLVPVPTTKTKALETINAFGKVIQERHNDGWTMITVEVKKSPRSKKTEKKIIFLVEQEAS